MQKMKQLRAIHNESAPQLQKILSPAQYQQLQAIRQQEIQQAIAKKRAHASARPDPFAVVRGAPGPRETRIEYVLA
jgi:hypothetical protein